MSLKINKEKIGILGYGEVGQAIGKFYEDPRLRERFGGQAKIKDLTRDDGLAGAKILHVCIPFDRNFMEIAKKEIEAIRPKLVIVHSTVAPGTTKKLQDILGREPMIVHSPIRGVHPHLYEGIKTFVKYIGADNPEAGELAKNHLESLGIKTKVFQPSVVTELGKLFDTSYYGLCIAWHGEMKEICDRYGVDFEAAATDFNKTYNEGYKNLKMDHVARPVLYHPSGCIGGHCIIKNAKILRRNYKSKALDLILKYKPKKKK